MTKDKFKTNPVAKKIKEENKKTTKRAVKKRTLEDELDDYYDNKLNEFDEIEVPTLGMVKHNGEWIKWGEYEQEIWQDGYNTKMSLTDKITWVLIAVNVAILIVLLIKNLK